MDTPKRKKRTEREGFSFTFDPDACKQCKGNCCIGESGNIFLNQKEIRAISEFLNMELSRFISDYLRKVSYKFSIREIKIKGSYLCVFFDDTNRRCSICYPTSMILTGETCEVFKTSQVFGGQTRHDHCGEVLPGSPESVQDISLLELFQGKSRSTV
ncbi:MAG: hypothetical protein DRI57_26045 [Deltaproteobacteria bacterium]|nr:MAG: hypothetical protein DRI57_26045 [Deltaproteobacteria bacterium]